MKYTVEEHQSKTLINPKLALVESAATFFPVISESNKQILKESTDSETKKKKLIVQMEAIHVGRTANYTFYTEQGLKDGITSWTHPYKKPVLTHHEQHRGEPIGRILKAEFTESTASGRKGLVFTVEITDSVAIEKVLDGRYQTVSIGATTDKVACNICGTDRTKEWCEHWRGEEYEGQTCHFTVGTTFGQEVSYVNVPADADAGNFSVEVAEALEAKILQVSENHVQYVHNAGVNLYENASDDLRTVFNGFVESDEEEAANMPRKLEINGVVESFTTVEETVVRMKAMLDELTEANKSIGTMTIEKTKLEESVTNLKESEANLITEADTLKAELHTKAAEKVVEMKIELRKPDVIAVTKEEAIETHAKRTKESLADLLVDLLAEAAARTVAPGSVKNPGQADPEKEKTMDVNEAATIFAGLFNSKKKKK